ncbi:ANTAR domain-containing protein [Streptomyces sp. NPDC048256]|uniref:ANTAR domain-containing protein n=1 Tax=unclassified Streptomyces TaxID=2593676 RepID=UPI0033E1BCC5
MLLGPPGRVHLVWFTRPVIDMARGVLIAGFGCNPEEARAILVAVSQHGAVRVPKVAETFTAAAAGIPVPQELDDHLAAAVLSCRAPHGQRTSG